MARQGEKMIKKYLEEKYNFKVDKIDETDEKTPDFTVNQSDSLLFYCEEKTLELVEFEGAIPDSTYNAISRKIRESAKQFKSINPKHLYPNVLVIINMDSMRDIHDLVITVTGKALTDKGKWIQIRHVLERLKVDLETVDMVMWFDKEKFANFVILNEKHSKELERIFEL
ncbi:hypothetical protein BACCIP111895_01957 [Neobacillus rhizosphaerae]|uniref:Uncharacterized protein n=1 Tax=Neobacillus rhizosphaerae TaxID=2880965 RepID=A0ABM9EQ91_9BACI|nr:hypothetical protein [Neobacillus rhizosphaerae]CAH2714781.1 hypothetical protein BACCIP111895_01957 [Neobacillus rhizosphaerae]